KKSHDFYQTQLTKTEGYLLISYYTSIIDQKKLEEHIFPIFRAPFYQSNNIKNINDIQKIIPIEDIIITDDIGCIKSKLMTGYAIIQITEKDKCCALVNISNTNAG
ncbi:spore germination protein, partial [Vibrio cholerae]|nr:spore germination protein [Vibrio cholerae]